MDIAVGIATIAASLIALVTLVIGVLEYSRQGAAKRAEHFLEMRRRLKENERFRIIAELLDTNDAELSNISFKDKRDYLGLFEEVALSMNSRLIRRQVAHYMFGYYAIRCWESQSFWGDVNRNSIYWRVFRDFVEQMQEVERGFNYHRRDFRF
jgi:alpha-D-ribose 1-methylphosphonate 5-triphosphate diphosphatase PhnM